MQYFTLLMRKDNRTICWLMWQRSHGQFSLVTFMDFQVRADTLPAAISHFGPLLSIATVSLIVQNLTVFFFFLLGLDQEHPTWHLCLQAALLSNPSSLVWSHWSDCFILLFKYLSWRPSVYQVISKLISLALRVFHNIVSASYIYLMSIIEFLLYAGSSCWELNSELNITSALAECIFWFSGSLRVSAKWILFS